MVPMTPQRWAAVGAGVLAVAALVGLVGLQGDGDSEQIVTGSTSSTVEETTTTVESTTTTTAALTTTTTAKAAVVTSTTAKATTTTTTGPRRTWSISPTSGPSPAQTTASGVGCTGANAGVTLRVYDPSGQEFNGDGGSAQPDGTWSVPVSFTGAPGRYKLTAECSGSAPFRYAAAQYFTIT